MSEGSSKDNLAQNDGNINRRVLPPLLGYCGVALLQEIFLKEHNAIVTEVANNHPGLSDDELYGIGRNVIAALVAKIHTVDWTLELLKTYTLKLVSAKCISVMTTTHICVSRDDRARIDRVCAPTGLDFQRRWRLG